VSVNLITRPILRDSSSTVRQHRRHRFQMPLQSTIWPWNPCYALGHSRSLKMTPFDRL